LFFLLLFFLSIIIDASPSCSFQLRTRHLQSFIIIQSSAKWLSTTTLSPTVTSTRTGSAV
jgi:hypothetical protein